MSHANLYLLQNERLRLPVRLNYESVSSDLNIYGYILPIWHLEEVTFAFSRDVRLLLTPCVASVASRTPLLANFSHAWNFFMWYFYSFKYGMFFYTVAHFSLLRRTNSKLTYFAALQHPQGFCLAWLIPAFIWTGQWTPALCCIKTLYFFQLHNINYSHYHYIPHSSHYEQEDKKRVKHSPVYFPLSTFGPWTQHNNEKFTSR